MLVLSRTERQRIRIGNDIWVSVESIVRGRVKLGFEAPSEVKILREEVIERDNQVQG